MEEKKKIIANPRNVFLFELIFFVLAQILAILSARRIGIIIAGSQGGQIEPLYFWDFLLSFVIATGLILLLVRLAKSGRARIPFKIIFFLVVLLGGFIFFSLWLGDLIALALLCFLFFLWFKSANIFIHNILLLCGVVGVGSMLSLRLQPSMIIVFLIIFSVYDFIAVYKTKHMVKMARAMIEFKAVLGLVLPGKISDFKVNLKETSLDNKFLVLGAGDVTFPLLLTVSLVSQGMINAFIVLFFSSLGLFLSFYIFISQKNRQPIPALPPIALLAIIGYWVSGFF